MGEATPALPRLSSRARGINPALELEAPGDPATFRNDASVRRLASDKIVVFKEALEGRLRPEYPESRIGEFPRSENIAAGSDAPCRHRLQTYLAVSTGAGLVRS